MPCSHCVRSSLIFSTPEQVGYMHWSIGFIGRIYFSCLKSNTSEEAAGWVLSRKLIPDEIHQQGNKRRDFRSLMNQIQSPLFLKATGSSGYCLVPCFGTKSAQVYKFTRENTWTCVVCMSARRLWTCMSFAFVAADLLLSRISFLKYQILSYL